MNKKNTGTKTPQTKKPASMAPQKKPPKKQSSVGKIKDADEFHKLNTKDAQGHLHYVCGKNGKKYESVGLTHAPRTKGQNNLPLKKNPNPKDPQKAYVRPKLTEEKRERYGKQLNNLGLNAEDKKKVWTLIKKLREEKKTKK